MDQFTSFVAGVAFTLFLYPFGRATQRIIPYLRNKPLFFNLKGNYVLVAGATDGIGYQYVKYLTQNDMNVIAIGRNQQKLQKLSLQYPNLLTIKTDFSRNLADLQHNQIAEHISQNLKQSGSKLVGMINSVGSAHFSPYNTLKMQKISQLNNTNINSLHFMLNLLKQLKTHGKLSQKPFFINISSIVSQEPHSYSTVYAATKAYISNLIQGVSQQQKNIVFLDVRPWFVKTKMVSFQDTWDTATPQQIVEGSFKVLGKKPFCSGCIKHELIDQFSWIFSEHFASRHQQGVKKMQKIKQKLKDRKKKHE